MFKLIETTNNDKVLVTGYYDKCFNRFQLLSCFNIGNHKEYKIVKTSNK